MLASVDYELKLLVDPGQTLDARREPTADVRAAFRLGERQTIVMQFVDSARLELDKAQWNVRIRAFEDEDELQVTYKKRYPIDDGDIDAALEQAVADGFKDDPEEYEAQVEWSLKSKTLSISRKTELASLGLNPLDLPDERVSRALCAAAVPARLERQVSRVWVRDVFGRAHLYGPVRGERWKGKWNGKTVSIEVWQIRGKAGEKGKRVVEVSVKEEDRDIAMTTQQQLHTFLKKRRWLGDDEDLKTRMVLERY